MTLSVEDKRDFGALLAAVPIGEMSKWISRPAWRSRTDLSRCGASGPAVLRRHRLYGSVEALTRPDIEPLIAGAIAFHDLIYQIGASDNEYTLGRFWLRTSAGSAFSDADRTWVAETICATRNHLDYEPNWSAGEAARLRERARLWVLDLDLSALGENAGYFARATPRFCAGR